MKSWRNLSLILGVIVLAALPLLMVSHPAPGPDDAKAEIFAGADGRAMEVVAGIAPAYTPWAKPLFTPPSGEVESLLFVFQAVLGAGFIGYYLGVSAGKSKRAGEGRGGAGC